MADNEIHDLERLKAGQSRRSIFTLAVALLSFGAAASFPALTALAQGKADDKDGDKHDGPPEPKKDGPPKSKKDDDKRDDPPEKKTDDHKPDGHAPTDDRNDGERGLGREPKHRRRHRHHRKHHHGGREMEKRRGRDNN